MADETVSAPATPVVDAPGRPLYRFASVAMLVVGSLCAVLSGAVKDVTQDKLAFITGAAVFIPLGIAGCAMAYTAAVKAVLVQRIEELERRLRDEGIAEPGAGADGGAR